MITIPSAVMVGRVIAGLSMIIVRNSKDEFRNHLIIPFRISCAHFIPHVHVNDDDQNARKKNTNNHDKRIQM